MFRRKEASKSRQLLEAELERVLLRLKIPLTDSEEYAKLLSIVERLKGLLDQEKSDSLSKDTMATVGANLLGILMIIRYEDVNVIVSKALNFVLKLRI